MLFHMDDERAIAAALDDVFDQALIFHGFTDYMRDYDLFIDDISRPKSPRLLRYRFTHCVRATATTSVSDRAWPDSLDDVLIDPEAISHPDGYVGFIWGVRWQDLYPGMRLKPLSDETREWTTRTGLRFHEVSIETNAHNIDLVFSALRVDSVEPGFAPYVVTAG